jgi:hypothetical protein
MKECAEPDARIPVKNDSGDINTTAPDATQLVSDVPKPGSDRQRIVN